MKNFAVLQLSSCAGCEVALLNAEEWIDQYRLAYMPLVTSAHTLPPVDVLFVSGSVHTDEDLHNFSPHKKLGVISQTTQSPDHFAEMVARKFYEHTLHS